MELPNEIHISPIFKIAYLTKFHDDDVDEELMMEPCPIHTSVKEEIEEIMDSHVGQSTRNRQYKEYLVKWKG